MGNRRFAQVATSDDEGDAPKPSNSSSTDDRRRRRESRTRLRKKMKFQEDEEEEEVEKEREGSRNGDGKEDEEMGEAEEEAPQEDAKPIGVVVRVTGKGRGRRNHYEAFEFDGNRFELEDPVLLTPEDEKQKPYVAIIKDITQTKAGSMMVTGQWFYRPEEAEKKGGGSWQARDTRELFYSFHRDEVPAESVMHKCVVHFVPLHKQLPIRKQHPGFIVQKVYDTEQRKLFKLTDKDYEDSKQHEIDLLVQKTMSRLGSLPDIEMEDTLPEMDEQTKNKRILRKKNISPLDVSREDDGITRSDPQLKTETPGSCAGNDSKYYAILADFKALTKETQRDKWLERLLQGVEYVCMSSDDGHGEDKGRGASNGFNHSEGAKCSDADRSQEKGVKGDGELTWPDYAVSAVTALEKASNEALSSDFTKYNQKLRQLVFNLKNNAFLARRLLKGELEPSKILSMSPTELKEGLTAEEIARNQPEESARMQMTDARCKRCTEKKVGLVDIIQAGHGDRYQLECIACGNIWYASRDEAAMLTIDGPSSVTSVGTAPWATAKFENVERKRLLSPREPPEKTDALRKAAEPCMSAPETTQKSPNKVRVDGGTASPKNQE
ncbi:hypothetical protein Nepgr_031585 [Nepenthes gracilis]|uniref:Bromo-adjacent homology (BAH) domain-containing protein n=1 Tax=Nepenthes gracilis TaxID=150966 RepID=A0AAD3Y4Y3_NEPGR|nr:hypothetical protein Nepgr_031585 [Nepenthes gracilis]